MTTIDDLEARLDRLEGRVRDLEQAVELELPAVEGDPGYRTQERR